MNRLSERNDQSKPGIVIIINGPSAAGKSTLQKAIQKNMPVPFLAVGIDTFFNDILPDEHGTLGTRPLGGFDQNDVRSVSLVNVEGRPAYKLNIGHYGELAIKGMHGAIASYAKSGNNVVVDYISYENHWPDELRKSLVGIETVYIGVQIDLDILEKREKARSTSPTGHARSHYFDVHNGFKYDLTVDTGKLSPEEASNQVIKFIKSNY